MAGTRSSARLAGQSSSPSSQNNSSPKSAAGTKRKSDAPSSSKPKRGKKGAGQEQKTIEESFPIEEPKSEPAAAANKSAAESGTTEASDSKVKEAREGAEAENVDESVKEHSDATSAKPNGKANGTKISDDISKTDDTGGAVEPKDEAVADAPQDDSKKRDAPALNHDESAIEAGAREDETPSSILEKGIIYFFFRARVNIEDPKGIDDVARSYIVLRPIPHGAKLGEGAIGDAGNCRLLALPKKVLPASGKDRFMVFVEKAKTSFKELKDHFMSASDYATKTAGTSHTPAVTPIGEGIYAVTTTGRESHLAYILTIPSELDEVQKDIGLRERGSFVTSIKNPEQKGPPHSSLPKGPEYPKETMDEFRGRRWMPLQPKHLDYPNAQLLIIGESHGLGRATEALDGDQRHNKETPLEEMEKLEGEDEIRVKHLKGDDAVFADLGLSSKEYPKVLTTW